jgi:hypothetical protein
LLPFATFPLKSFAVIVKFCSTTCVGNAVSLNKTREIDNVGIRTGSQRPRISGFRVTKFNIDFSAFFEFLNSCMFQFLYVFYLYFVIE